MLISKFKNLVFAAILYGVPHVCSAQPFNVQLTSDPGDWVGAGTTWSFTPENSEVYVVRRNDAGGIDFYIQPFGATGMWHFNFSAQRRIPLVPDNYEEAQRFDFNSFTKPGLSVSGDHRGCNEVAGRFIVREAVYGSSGEVVSFAIDLEQHCEGQPPALRGVIRYNSQVPLVVPTPNAAAGADKTMDEGATVTLDGSKSSDGDGNIVSYRWTQLAGAAVTLTAPDAARTDFLAPPVNEGGSDLVFELQATDNDGQIDTDRVTIHVVDEFDPKSTLSLVGEAGDVVIGEAQFFYSINEGVFGAVKDMGDSISLSFRADPANTAYLRFAAPGNVRLVPGTYENATRYPFQLPTEPGLDVSVGVASCNQLTGRFVVDDARYGDDGSILSFAADFEQQCSNATGGLKGRILYNYRKPKPFPVLTLAVTDTPDPVSARDKLTYHINLRNDGAVTATDVRTTTTLPSQVSFISASPACSLTGAQATCNFGSLGGGIAASADIVVKTKKKGTISASTSAFSAETGTTNSLVTNTVVQ
jgi:uncharacterized repeat protein (TIGR01451 family)